VSFYECSAKLRFNIDLVFSELVKLIINYNASLTSR
jgi:hypothetical protein